MASNKRGNVKKPRLTDELKEPLFDWIDQQCWAREHRLEAKTVDMGERGHAWEGDDRPAAGNGG
jgi:hypothetical protein